MILTDLKENVKYLNSSLSENFSGTPLSPTSATIVRKALPTAQNISNILCLHVLQYVYNEITVIYFLKSFLTI